LTGAKDAAFIAQDAVDAKSFQSVAGGAVNGDAYG